MVVRSRSLDGLHSKCWMMTTFRVLLMLSLMATSRVVRGVPSRLTMRRRLRRVRPFLGAGALGVVEAGATACVGFAGGIAFFFFPPLGNLRLCRGGGRICTKKRWRRWWWWWCGGRSGRPWALAFKSVHAQKLVLNEFEVFFELFGLIEGLLTKAANLLVKGGVLRGRTRGAEVVGSFGVGRVDGGGYGGVLILQGVDVLA